MDLIIYRTKNVLQLRKMVTDGKVSGVLFTIAPSLGTQTEKQKYDYSKKITFALDPIEISAVIRAIETNFKPVNNKPQINFLHDQAVRTDKAGELIKTLVAFPSGENVNLTISAKPKNADKTSYSIILNPHEITAIKYFLISALEEIWK